jgi:hypothetical protein
MAVTIVFGAMIEIEEGATLTGNCRMRDLLPDAIGGFLGIGVILLRNTAGPSESKEK